ncbi:MAG TPA: hypothetical protein VJ866_14625 [Pyrinomonadaceae bacterium]|nr:hypothetical protein [Pyrinomonadaceae bacterium]
MKTARIDSASDPAARDVRLSRAGRSVKIVAPVGTFSYYHPRQPFTGYGWDTQSASLLLLDPEPDSILILGLGGGTAARQCRLMFPRASIVGVDSDPRVLELAYRHCDLRSCGVEVRLTTGTEFLRRTRRRFCAVIDDMWPPERGGPKPIFCEPDWMRLVRSRLRPRGLYAVNLYSRRAHASEVPSAIRLLAPHFRELRELRPGLGPTAVLAAGDELLSPRAARARLARLPNRWAGALGHVSFLKVRSPEREA